MQELEEMIVKEQEDQKKEVEDSSDIKCYDIPNLGVETELL